MNSWKEARLSAAYSKGMTAEQATSNALAFCSEVEKKGYDSMVYGIPHSFRTTWILQLLEAIPTSGWPTMPVPPTILISIQSGRPVIQPGSAE